MKNFILILLLIAPLLFVACSEDDEPAPSHEVGVWELDSYALINFPETFSRYEGIVAGVSDITFGGIAYEDYTLTLENNGNVSIEIGVQGPDLDDSGTWELDDDEIELELDDAGDITWKIEKNEDDDLWLSEEAQFAFIPNIYYDTVSQAYLDYLDTLTDAQVDSVSNALLQAVTCDLVYVFERQ